MNQSIFIKEIIVFKNLNYCQDEYIEKIGCLRENIDFWLQGFLVYLDCYLNIGKYLFFKIIG